MEYFKRYPVLLIIFVAVLFSCGGKNKEAKAFPSKPVTVLIGFKPGGGSDAIAQLAERFLEKVLDIPVVSRKKYPDQHQAH